MRGEEGESERGGGDRSQEECGKCKEYAIINATQHVDPLAPEIFGENPDYGFASVIDYLPLRRRNGLHV